MQKKVDSTFLISVLGALHVQHTKALEEAHVGPQAQPEQDQIRQKIHVGGKKRNVKSKMYNLNVKQSWGWGWGGRCIKPCDCKLFIHLCVLLVFRTSTANRCSVSHQAPSRALTLLR